jgi:hypothetical protein
MHTKPEPQTCEVWPKALMVSCGDQNGETIYDSATSLLVVYAMWLDKKGINPDGLLIRTPFGSYRILRIEDNGWRLVPLVVVSESNHVQLTT